MTGLDLLLARIPKRVFSGAMAFSLAVSFMGIYLAWREIMGPIFAAWPWMQAPLF